MQDKDRTLGMTTEELDAFRYGFKNAPVKNSIAYRLGEFLAYILMLTVFIIFAMICIVASLFIYKLLF